MSLKKVLEELTGAYYEEAPKDEEYPYAVFSMRRISESEGLQSYTLEINVWDQHTFYSRAESMMDALEEKLHRCSHRAAGFRIRCFKGPRQNVPDPDKSIKRVREQFEMKIYGEEI